MAQKQLVFVYNTDSAATTKFFGWWFRLLSPSTYPCTLLKLTYGVFGRKKHWQLFLRKLEAKKSFLYADEFHDKFTLAHDGLPAVFLQEGLKVKIVVKSSEINECKDLDELLDLMTAKLQKI